MSKLELIKQKTIGFLTKQDFDAVIVTEDGFVLNGTLIYRIPGLLELKDEPERKVHYVDVGDLSNEKTEKYMNEIVQKFKEEQTITESKNEPVEILEPTFTPEENNDLDTIKDVVSDSFDKEFNNEPKITQLDKKYTKKKRK